MEFGHLEGEQPYLGDLLTMVISHLLTGMILQVHPAKIYMSPKKGPFQNGNESFSKPLIFRGKLAVFFCDWGNILGVV